MKNLTTTLLCSVAMVGFVGTQAQASSAGPAPWEGLHVGAGISGAVMTGENNTTFHTDEGMQTAGFSSTGSSEFDLELSEDMWDSGAFGTIEAGYDWALDNSWVAGIGVDYTFGTLDGSGDYERCGDYIDNNGDLSSDGCASLTSEAEIKNSWSAIARVGKAIHPNFLVYGLGGVTRSKINASASGAICENLDSEGACDDGVIRRNWSRSDHDDGLTLGGGVEVWLHGAWSGKMEYRHTNYDALGSSFADTDCAGIGGDDCNGSTRFDSKVHSLRFVLSRKIDLSGSM